MLLEPKEICVKTLDGEERAYIISKFPAVAGREILTQYPLSAVPKIGDYRRNEELMLKIMGYVAAMRPEGEPIVLSNRALVDNWVPDWETLARIELSIIDYNCSFFRDGRASTFFAGLGQKAGSKITAILTDLSAKLSHQAKPR